MISIHRIEHGWFFFSPVEFLDKKIGQPLLLSS